ncbi:MAG: SIS domain-containing protein [Microcystis sp.]|jgi:D-sedoheptulose 7-phosphate isomerase|uniref:Phosphoheptose isomerase n=1 Tax=Microcystis aeruginosa BLCC-F158 TaxID=2755316 RepID=A0A841V6H2_MICAE|nr:MULTISPECIES: SIS domain-containing protein [Microcystis]MBC1196574.1 SIS domain-containing protein [Microcystis aeruginosa BLCC-F158]MCZ8065412.1 SIS domain-containing protein [Microcystis sp. LE17-20D]MCZ8160267.1 SIS domain-containing protein [Microcystis sp. LE19-196.1B]MCZ8275905.1 SIS domain-containing protein [Microcystis sp. LE19-4.1E]
MPMAEKSNKKLDSFQSDPSLSILIKTELEEAYVLKKNLLTETKYLEKIQEICQVCINAYRNNHKVLVAGNGGSAADAIHFGGELHGRFLKERQSLPVRVLNSDIASLTAIANDYGYEYIFSRQIEAEGNPGDVFIGISTSGNSANIHQALKVCQAKGLTSIGLTGAKGLALEEKTDYCLMIPSTSTPRIQEGHGFVLHTICLAIEEALFPN